MNQDKKNFEKSSVISDDQTYSKSASPPIKVRVGCKQPSSTTSVYSMYSNNAGPKIGEKSVCSVIPEERETPAVTQDVKENKQLDCTSQS